MRNLVGDRCDFESALAAADLAASLAAAHGRLTSTVDALDRRLRDLDVACATTAAAAEAAASAAEDDAATCVRRRAALDGMRKARAGLLGGEPTEEHRRRHEGLRRAARGALADAEATLRVAEAACRDGERRAAATHGRLDEGEARVGAARRAVADVLAPVGRAEDEARRLLAIDPLDVLQARDRVAAVERAIFDATTTGDVRRADLAAVEGEADDPGQVAAVEAAVADAGARVDATNLRIGALGADLARDDDARERVAGVDAALEAARVELATWAEVDDAIGSASGGKFRSFAQGVTLDHLVLLANGHLAAFNPRYRLRRGSEGTLALHVVDLDMGEEVRAARSLSGGERFLTSLALSGLEGGSSIVDTLFVDEGFGSLDAETLDVAVDALEALQGLGRKVGVVTHVAGMVERIAVQVRVAKRGGGRSVVEVSSAGATPG